MPNDFRELIFAQYSAPQNLEGNPRVPQIAGAFSSPRSLASQRLLLEPHQSPGLRIGPEEEEWFSLGNLKGLFLGLGDIAKIPFSLVGNIANAITPGVELGDIPTPFGPLSSELGIKPTPQSFSEVPGALGEATGIPDLVRHSYTLANDPTKSSASIGLETLARIAGELTISPLLDVSFNMGIDPARSNLPIEEKWRQFPMAALGLLSAVKAGGILKSPLGKKTLFDIGQATERKSLLAKTDFGGETFERFAFRKGMSVSTPEGLGIIDNITDAGRVYVTYQNGKRSAVKKGEIFAQVSEPQKIADGFPQIAARAKELTDERGLSFTPDFLKEFLESKVMAQAFMNRMGGLLSRDEIKTLNTTDQLYTVLDRSIDVDGVAQRIMKESNGSMDITAALGEAKRTKAEFINALKATSTESGQTLQFFSEVEHFFTAADRMSKDPAIRLLALEKETRVFGVPDWWEKVINQAQLASMVSQPVTAARNLWGQFSRSIIQATEQAAFETRLFMREKRKLTVGEEVNPNWLTKEGNIDLSKMYAETLGNLYTAKDALQDVVPRSLAFAKNAVEMGKYSAQVFRALHKGEDVLSIPKPEAYKGRFAWLDDVVQAVPTEAMKLLNHPTGETATAYFDAVTLANLTRSAKRLLPERLGGGQDLLNNSRWHEFVAQTLPATSSVFSGFFTTMNRMAEIEQRRLFFASRLRGNALRRGLSLDEWTKSLKLEQTKGLEKQQAFVKLPNWMSEDLTDATQYALETTYAADPRGSVGAKVMQIYAAAPILKQIAPPFPRFFFNRWAFITERNPGIMFNMLKKEVRDQLDGKVTREQVIESMRAKAESKGRKFKPPSDTVIDNRLNDIRQKAQIQSARVMSQATMGSALLGMGWFLRNSARAGARPFDFDIGQRDENGNVQWASLKNYGPELQFAIGLAAAYNGVREGKDLLKDVFTQEEFLDMAIGIRELDETAFAIFDLPELASVKGTPEAITQTFATILGSNIGRFFTFMQQFKDVAGITDFRGLTFEGSDELLMTDQMTDPFIGNSIRSLPRGIQRAIYKGEPPSAESPFRSQDLQAEEPLLRAFIGMNLSTKTKLETLVDSVNMRWSDAIGRQPSPMMSRLVASELGNFFDTEVSQGFTVGDLITDRVLQLEARTRAAGIKDPAVRRTALREIFSTARASVVPKVRMEVVRAAIESGDPNMLLRIFGPTLGKQFDELTRELISGRVTREF